MENQYKVKLERQRVHVEYECHLAKLKKDAVNLQQEIQRKAGKALIKKCQTLYQVELEQLRSYFTFHPELRLQASSFFAVPTRELPDDQRFIHRIWLGGIPPFEVSQAIDQWFCAIKAVQRQGVTAFRQILWVWEAGQMNEETHFNACQGSDPDQLGILVTPQGEMQINALSSLLTRYPGTAKALIFRLYEKGYYATLSDYFRLLILNRHGGVYMDADTLPYKPVGWFLLKPEIPDFLHLPVQGEEGVRLSCLNLYLDETGMIIAAKDDHSLKQISDELNEAYLRLPVRVPDKNIIWERQVFGLFYAIWRKHLSRTLISHDDFCQQFAVFTSGVKEAVPCGIKGMRLLEDIITGEKRPLSAEESVSYQRAVTQLSAQGWTLTNPLLLSHYAEVYDLDEHPRIAYSLQMRSEVEHFHYYSVLSEDRDLDRVNALFGRYLLARNQQAIDAGNFWQPVLHWRQGEDVSREEQPFTPAALIFIRGEESTSQQRNQMAKLIFSTSYLEYCSVGNPAGLDIVALQRAQNIEPWLAFTTLVCTPEEEFAGFFISGLTRDLERQKVPSLYREEIHQLDRNYQEFVASHSQPGDYFIASLALEPLQRGKGYFQQMLKEIYCHAGLLDAKRITLCCWERSDARLNWHRQGFRQKASLKSCQPLFGDQVIFMESEVKSF